MSGAYFTPSGFLPTTSLGAIVKNSFEEAGSMFVAGGKKTLYVLNRATSSLEARGISHAITEGIIKIVELAGAVIPALGILGSIISTFESISNGFDLAQGGQYFFEHQSKFANLPRFKKMDDGTLDVKDKHYEGTKLQHHIKTGKLQKVAAQIGFAIKSVGVFVTLLDAFKMIDLAAYSAQLSKLAHVGGVISKIVSPLFFTMLAGVGGIIAYGALTVDSVIYLTAAIKGDPDKSIVKGLLQLGSRVAFLTLSILAIAQVTNPYAIIPLLVVGGVLGIAAIIYTEKRGEKKAEIQKELIKEVQAQIKMQEELNKMVVDKALELAAEIEMNNLDLDESEVVKQALAATEQHIFETVSLMKLSNKMIEKSLEVAKVTLESRRSKMGNTSQAQFAEEKVA